MLSFQNDLLKTVQSDVQADYTISTADQCSNAKDSLGIAILKNYKLNNTQIEMSSNTCINVTVLNVDTIVHTITINADSSKGVSYFNIYVTPGSIVSRNFQSPDRSIQIKYYCSVPGHDSAGVNGLLIIGQQSSTAINQNDAIATLILLIFLVTMGIAALIVFIKGKSLSIGSPAKKISHSSSSIDNLAGLVCYNCNSKVIKDDVFCQNCGVNLTNEKKFD